EPFGPMIACVSPERTARSTPRRISRLVPDVSSTPTWRSRISRMCSVAIYSFLLVWQRDVHVVAVRLHRVDRHRLGGRRPGGLAGGEIEAGPVQPALHRVVVDVALGQRDLLV